MHILQLFPNLAILKISSAKDESIILPNNLENISLFSSDLKLLKSQNQVTKISIGDYVTVDGIDGVVENINDNNITIFNNDSLIIIKDPKMIVVKNKLNTINMKSRDIVSGIIEDLFFVPTYIVILQSDNNDIINNMILSALINATKITPFAVDNIIFDTKS